jgi:class 3 adenylate cyclase
MRLTGDAYFAVCGATRLHLDHASRSAAFVRDIVELIDDLDTGGAVTISAGIDSGPITVGLMGGQRLVHDTWGPTVRRATELARTALPGQVLVSASVRDQLPPTHAVVDAPDGDEGVGILTGIMTESEPAS